MPKVIIIAILLLSNLLYGAEIVKATGVVKVTIIKQQDFEVNFEKPNAIVWTEIGATAQIVF